MQSIATQKFLRMSPNKLRVVADVVRDLGPKEAIETLPFLKKRAAGPIRKVLLTAIANAKVKGIADEGQLKIKEIQINEGPRLKRGRPVSRGRWHPYQRKMSHIRIVLETIEKEDSTSRPSRAGKESRIRKTGAKVTKTVKSVKKIKSEGSLKKKTVRSGPQKDKAKKSFAARAKSIIRTRTTNK